MMNNKNIQAILFDLDGTMFDTASDLAFSINTVLTKYHKPTTTVDVIRQHVSLGTKAMIQCAIDINENDPEYAVIYQDCLQTYSENLSNTTTFFPKMDYVLTYLDQANIDWGIVTNKPYSLTKSILEDFNLMHRVKCIIGGDSLPQKKPDPMPLLHACNMLQKHPENVAYIGDAETDIIAAKAANMTAIAALYGYPAIGAQPKNWPADYFIQAPIEILELFADIITND